MNQHYPHMFAPLTVGNITFKNRVFSAPTTAHMIQNNAPSYPEPSYIATYLEKARGGVACVSCGGQKVTLTGRNPVHTEFNITEPAGWRNFIHMTSAMHFYDARCSYELIHFGSEGEYTEGHHLRLFRFCARRRAALPPDAGGGDGKAGCTLCGTGGVRQVLRF